MELGTILGGLALVLAIVNRISISRKNKTTNKHSEILKGSES